MDLAPFIYALHEEIDLAKYGEGLKKLYFTFLVMPADDKVLVPYRHYWRKKEEADISVRIPYDQAVSASESEIVKLMELAYLKGVDQLATYSTLRQKYDVAGLRRDVEALFAKEGWYEIEKAA